MRPTRRNAQQDNANKKTGMNPFGTVLKESMKSNAHSNDNNNNNNKPSSEAVAVGKTTMTAPTTLSSTRDHLPVETRTLLESMEKELEQRMMPIRRAAEKDARTIGIGPCGWSVSIATGCQANDGRRIQSSTRV